MLTAYSIAALFILLLAVTIFCFAAVVKVLSPFITAQLEIIIATIFVAIGLIFLNHISIVTLFTLPTINNWYWLTLSGIAGFLGGNYYALLNMQLTHEVNNSLLSPAITVTASLLAVIFLNDNLTIAGFFGLIITVLAVTAYQYNQFIFKAVKLGFASGWVCVAFTSLSIICAIKGTANSNIFLLHSIFLRLFPVFILVLFLRLFSKQNLLPIIKTTSVKILWLLIVGILLQTIIATYLWFIASLSLGVSRFQVLIALLPFAVALIDAVLLKRKHFNSRFFLTALLAFIGVLLMFWQDL